MKKLIALTMSMALLVSAIMLMSVVPVSATASLTDIVVSKVLASGVYTFTVTFTATDVDQVTLLATRGAETAPETINNDTVVGIDQVPATAGSFTFAVDAAKFVAVTTPKIYIKLGGTAIDTAISQDPILMVEETTSYTVVGYVDVIANRPSTVTLKTGTTTTTDATGRFEFTGVVAGSYDITFGAKSALIRTIPVTVVDAPVIVSSDTNKITLLYGDTNGSGTIDFDDLMAVKTAYNTQSADIANGTSIDTDNSGVVDFDDLMVVKTNYNKAITNYTPFSN